MIDTGQACSDESWICPATENRAPYVVMDAMGYHFIFADGLAADTREQLQANVQAQLLPADNVTVTYEGQKVMLAVSPTLPEARFQNSVLLLPQPPQGMIRQIQIELDTMSLLEMATIPIASDEALDPTIMAVVEFVESEARYYQQKKKGSNE